MKRRFLLPLLVSTACAENRIAAVARGAAEPDRRCLVLANQVISRFEDVTGTKTVWTGNGYVPHQNEAFLREHIMTVADRLNAEYGTLILVLEPSPKMPPWATKAVPAWTQPDARRLTNRFRSRRPWTPLRPAISLGENHGSIELHSISSQRQFPQRHRQCALLVIRMESAAAGGAPACVWAL